GGLVPQVAAAAGAAGWQVTVFDLSGRADLAALAPVRLSLDDADAATARLRRSGADHLCTIGGLDFTTAQRRAFVQALGGTAGITGTSDLKLTEAIAAFADSAGMRLVGIQELLPGAIATEGLIAGPRDGLPSAERCRAAIAAARTIGMLDLGQAVVMAGDRLIAAEGVEGTAGLIGRVKDYVDRGVVDARIGQIVLAKCLKPGQLRHIDMPAIGPDTISQGAAAGISAVLVEAGGTLLIERAALETAANRLGVTVAGLKLDE
ncbi:MAG TPA: UDP-2,3-diacylglucosamine diphosphatase LpxI, partial [Devosiaceae bacterium]|nr:UDP-2,3-diacylglucosamine diphosphatase LpxI [Devosiaceae bacterium]